MLALAIATLTLSATPELTEKQLQILNTLNASGPRIDACVARYHEEQPGLKGEAKVSVDVDPEGKLRTANVTTGLPQARTLRDCLVVVARAWSLPPPESEDGGKLSITIPVRPGAKFRIPKPGEKPPEPDASEEEPPPPQWFNPASTGFLPSGW